MLSRIALRTTSSQAPLRSFSVLSSVRAEGAPSGKGESSYNKRERAEEERYIREHELEQLKSLQKSVEASRAHLEKLEKDHKELEQSIKSRDQK